MPDLATLSLSSSSSSLSRCSSLKPPLSLSDSSPVKPPVNAVSQGQNGNFHHHHHYSNNSSSKQLEDCVSVLMESKPSRSRSGPGCSALPFLTGAEKAVQCLLCRRLVHSEEDKVVQCSVRSCQATYHAICVKEQLGVSSLSKFKCLQHGCFVCKQKFHWRCVRCFIAAHDKCAPWPDKVVHLVDQPGKAICWRHSSDWLLDNKCRVPTTDVEEIFCRLPLPYVDEEFSIKSSWKGLTEKSLEPPSYIHIKRNVYLVKRKRDYASDDLGCRNCSSMCSNDCVCRVQCISCSKACHCPENCSNRPFRKEKKIKIVKTEFCGWGVAAAEPINKGDFIIEYIGEVIDDRTCEKRLWDMKYKGVQNFYMCEIRKDFTIDATFKGNTSRFLNHSCDPNCILEKWQVEGETRVGVFAACSVGVGEPLTYDYRFVQFGPEVMCYCGASNCQGYLGTKRKTSRLNICIPLNISWGAKRRRTHAIRTV